MCDSNERKYCEKCGTPLEKEYKMIEVLYQKLMKAKNDTDINLTEAYEYAKEKGWEE